LSLLTLGQVKKAGTGIDAKKVKDAFRAEAESVVPVTLRLFSAGNGSYDLFTFVTGCRL
jgi:hypothetical protein